MHQADDLGAAIRAAAETARVERHTEVADTLRPFFATCHARAARSKAQSPLHTIHRSRQKLSNRQQALHDVISAGPFAASIANWTASAVLLFDWVTYRLPERAFYFGGETTWRHKVGN